MNRFKISLVTFRHFIIVSGNFLKTFLEAFLEDDESVDAEIFVNKASTIMNNISDRAINLRYRTTFARVLDANRKFLEASSRYFELSNTAIGNVSAVVN